MMKKKTYLILKILGGLLLVMIVILFTVPVIFKDKIRTSIEKTISESVNARVRFGDYRLGLFRNFPNITFSIDDLSVTGIDKFENDTLIDIRSLNLVLNLPSLFRKSGYEIRSVRIDDAEIRAHVLSDGSENWNIIRESAETETEDESSTDMKILLRSVEMLHGRISYLDLSSDIVTELEDVNFRLTGDMTANETNLKMLMDAGKLTFEMEGMKYLNGVKASADIDLFANIDSMKFYLKENYLLLNDLKINFAGVVTMPYDDIETDLSFHTVNTSIKSLMSLIPAVYMSDYNDLTTSGEIEISGFAKGIYSDSDSTMPDISLNIKVDNGLINYPSLPEKIRNIYLRSSLFADGKDMDRTTFNVENLHMELAGNPFDLKFSLKTPMSDPDFSGSVIGKIDLTALKKALPLDSIDLSGLIDLSIRMAGRMSMIEKSQFDRFEAAGNMNLRRMMVSMTGYPAIRINDARLEFSPEFAEINNSSINVGTRSDFSLNGKLENYIPYLIKDGVIKGNLSLRSQMLDLSEILSSIAEEPEDKTDTTGLAVIKIPGNLDFDFNALIDQFVYNKIKANNLKGHIIVRNGILSIKETGLNILGGAVVLNADYDTRDTLKPFMKADLVIENLGIKDAFNTFNTVQKLAPAANGIDGRFGIKLSYSSLLGRDFMPV
ncbi:MAG: AsmA family protein, partial [Bacteroidales bacterium]|nr:AsmA family protein [Bacteroidales bacterium]